jgi:hypothetical protein
MRCGRHLDDGRREVPEPIMARAPRLAPRVFAYYARIAALEIAMGHSISVRLDEDMQTTLADAAKARGIGLSTYPRELAANEVKRLRRERIRTQSRAVGAYVAASPAGQVFYDQWGTHTAEGLPIPNEGLPS